MAEPNPSFQLDGENSLFGPTVDNVHVQGHQRDEPVREESASTGIPNFFGSATWVIQQTTPDTQNTNHGAGPSAPSAQAQPNGSALLGLPEGETQVMVRAHLGLI
ncbi:hypothetical protein Hanom_Chr05g00425431 [Helianthus anomalus]